MSQRRRDFLRAAGGLALAGASGVSGCLRFVGGGSATTVDYRNSLPAPGELPAEYLIENDEGYRFWATSPSALDSNAGEFVAGAEQLHALQDLNPFRRVSIDDASTMIMLNGARRVSMLDGGFDKEGLTGEIETEKGFERDTSIEDHDVYVPSEETEMERGLVVAISSDSLLWTRQNGQAQLAMEAVIDARAGLAERYADVDSDIETLLDTLGSGTLVTGGLPSRPNIVDDPQATGAAWSVKGQNTDFTGVVVYQNEEIPISDYEEWLRKDRMFDGFESTDMQKNGRTMTVTGTVETDRIDQMRVRWPGSGSRSGSGRSDSGSEDESTNETPRATFDFEYTEVDTDAGRLVITHQGGDSIPRDELYVSGTGFSDQVSSVQQAERGPWRGSASGEGGEVAAGDRVIVGVESNCRIRVVYRNEDVAATLAQFEGPDA